MTIFPLEILRTSLGPPFFIVGEVTVSKPTINVPIFPLSRERKSACDKRTEEEEEVVFIELYYKPYSRLCKLIRIYFQFILK